MGNHKTGTLQQDRLSIASAEAGAFPQQPPTSHGSSTSLHGFLPTTQQQPLLKALGGPVASVAPHCSGIKSVLPSGHSAMTPLPTLTPKSSGGIPLLIPQPLHLQVLPPKSYPFPKPSSTWALGIVSSAHSILLGQSHPVELSATLEIFYNLNCPV